MREEREERIWEWEKKRRGRGRIVNGRRREEGGKKDRGKKNEREGREEGIWEWEKKRREGEER